MNTHELKEVFVAPNAVNACTGCIFDTPAEDSLSYCCLLTIDIKPANSNFGCTPVKNSHGNFAIIKYAHKLTGIPCEGFNNDP